MKRGLGLSMHTWGGRGHNSDCDLTINPDGSVEIKMATQDLGTGAARSSPSSPPTRWAFPWRTSSC